MISEAIEKALRATGAKESWHMLEVGCNCGRNLNYLYESDYKNVYGVEINPAAVEHAWQVFSGIARKIVVSDAQSFLAMRPPNDYDLIYSQSLLLHVPPEDDYLFGQMARVAKRGVLTCEAETNAGSLRRHKYDRNYKAVFGGLGLRQIYKMEQGRRTIRVFAK
jgi:SAM-dependent methyltransferase